MTTTAKPIPGWLARVREVEARRMLAVQGFRATEQAAKDRERGRGGWKPTGNPIPAPVAR